MVMKDMLLRYRQGFIRRQPLCQSPTCFSFCECLFGHVEEGCVCVYIYVETTTSGVILGNDTSMSLGQLSLCYIRGKT